MRKVRSNALWNELSAENQQILDAWLFENKMSFAEALPRAQRTLGFKGSIGSLKRYYKRRAQERLLTKLEEAGKDVAKAATTGASPDGLRNANMRIVGVYLFQALRENPDSLKELMPVVKAMLQNDYNETLRESKAEDRKLREKALEFAREKFQFNMAEQAVKALPELMALNQARKDPAVKHYEENIRRNRLRRAIFGVGREIEPESAQEAAEMLAAKREREARQAAEREAEAERQRIREELGGTQPPPPSSPYYKEYMAEHARREAEEQQEREKLKMQNGRAQAPAAPETEESSEISEARKAEREELRKQDAIQEKFERLRELCGWQELQRPPGGLEPD